ncbi:MAG: hypothetical protein HQM09_05685 [Candidatus Riflebacteria bacterium]|nr:hypothetical protein [Candidatus Riflebacteria bacterium]
MKTYLSWLLLHFITAAVAQILTMVSDLSPVRHYLNLFAMFCWITATLGLAGVSTGFRQIAHDLEIARTGIGSVDEIKVAIRTLGKLEASSLLSGVVILIATLIQLAGVADDASKLGAVIAHLFSGSLFSVAGARIFCYCAALRLRSRIPDGLTIPSSNLMSNMLVVALPLINLVAWGVIVLILTATNAASKGGQPGFASFHGLLPG